MSREKCFPIERGHILQFARAVGDPNPLYSDPEYAAATEPGAILAPPTFLMAADHFDPDYERRPRVGEPWRGSGREPSGVPSDQLWGQVSGYHAEQHFEYHRHPRAGDVLTWRSRPGRTWEKVGRRSGQLRFTETITEFFDESGELVVTARWVSVATERRADR